MRINLMIYIGLILLLSSCIGDALVAVNYSVRNKTDRPLRIQGKSVNDTSILIPPHSEKVIYANRFICGFSDCRYKIQNDTFLKSVNYCFVAQPDQTFELTLDHWRIKKRNARTIIKN